MGAYCSVCNDTKEDMYIKYGPNMDALQWATIGASIAAAIATAGAAGPLIGGAVAMTGAGLGLASKQLDHELRRHGYSCIPPGGTYKSEKLTLSLALQANIVFKGSTGARIGTLPVWTGPGDGDCNQYYASNATYKDQQF